MAQLSISFILLKLLQRSATREKTYQSVKVVSVCVCLCVVCIVNKLNDVWT